jgi:hypothetical protein
MECRSPQTAGPPPAVRRALSLVIVLHFLAVLTAVTSASSPGFPAPELAVRANALVRPYLQLTFLTSPYRFFAPNPGPVNVLWFRLRYADGSVRWVELPRREDFVPRMAYQRHLSVAMLLGQQVVPADDGGARLTELGQVYLASYVRHLARTRARPGPGGAAVAVRGVGVYTALHGLLTPAQVRAGWEVVDLRTYQATFLGAYDPDGNRTGGRHPDQACKPISHVAAGILAVDYYPRLRRDAGADPRRLADELGLPAPIRRLLVRFPELLAPGAEKGDLPGRIENLVAAGGGA